MVGHIDITSALTAHMSCSVSIHVSRVLGVGVNFRMGLGSMGACYRLLWSVTDRPRADRGDILHLLLCRWWMSPTLWGRNVRAIILGEIPS